MLHGRFITILVNLGVTIVVAVPVLGGALYFFAKIWAAGRDD